MGLCLLKWRVLISYALAFLNIFQGLDVWLCAFTVGLWTDALKGSGRMCEHF